MGGGRKVLGLLKFMGKEGGSEKICEGGSVKGEVSSKRGGRIKLELYI